MKRTTVAAVAVLLLAGTACATTNRDTEDDPTAAATKASDGEAKESEDSSSEASDGSRADASEGPPEGFSGADVMNVFSTPGGSAVVLKNGDGNKVVPIFISRSQAMAIKLRLERRRYTRPLTHDLLDNIVEELDGEVTKVHIDAVKSGVFVGTVYVRAPENTLEFDARSSDAIALAVGNQVPIYVADRVFEKAGVPAEKFENRDLGKPKNPFPSPEKEKKKKKKKKEEEKGPYF